MGEIVNLRQSRKARRRADAEREAAANRVAFGRSKVERQQTASERALADKRLEDHRRDRTP